MKSNIIAIGIITTISLTPLLSMSQKSAIAIVKNEKDSLSYSLGLSVGNNLVAQGLDKINTQVFTIALEDAIRGTSQISQDEANAIINKIYVRKQTESGKMNLEAGIKYLAENAKKKGVVTLKSGLQYEILKKGTGKLPTAENTVKTHYHGTLINGKVFDSSVERNQPAEFPVNQVIAGWTEALQLMSVGSKWRLVIPSNLAYGEKGAGGAIEPNSTLIFEVELLDIVK